MSLFSQFTDFLKNKHLLTEERSLVQTYHESALPTMTLNGIEFCCGEPDDKLVEKTTFRFLGIKVFQEYR